MAFSAKARLVNELSRSRMSSPHADDYATAASAGSFDIGNDQIINSTVNMGNDVTAERRPPVYLDNHPYEQSESGSDGSAEMSIELGRGVKRGPHDVLDDVSSNLIFGWGNGSQEDFAGAPPFRPRTTSRKSDDALRRQASLRRATEMARSSKTQKGAPVDGAKHRTLSATLAKLNAEIDSSYVAQDNGQAAAHTRNTRFARSRHVSAADPSQPSRPTPVNRQDGTLRRQAVNNPTVQSGTHTANSFMLPNLPNLTELISGARKDGTPVFDRITKSRSRFTSGTYNPTSQRHIPLDNVPIPDEEKAIFSSLQLLKDKVAELEVAKSEAEKRAEEYEDEIIDLRSQLQMSQQRPDSALGSEEEGSPQERWRMEKTKLQASVKALQDRLHRSERKVSVSEIAVKRVTKERDELVTQIGVAYYNNEELKSENESFRDAHTMLQAENEDLKEEVAVLRAEVQVLRNTSAKSIAVTMQMEDAARATQSVTSRGMEKQERLPRSKKEGRVVQQENIQLGRKSSTRAETVVADDMAARVAREVQKQMEEAMPTSRREHASRGSTTRARSKSTHRQQPSSTSERRASAPKRAVSAPIESGLSDVESTTELHITQKTRDTLRSMHLPSPAKSRLQPQLENEDENSRDITYLSFLDPNDVVDLRRRLESELRAKRDKRNAPYPAVPLQSQREETVRSQLPRKSSLKDLTSGLRHVETAGTTGRSLVNGEAFEELSKAAKTVRVQSPHTSDASALPQERQQQAEDPGEMSVLSNTSRRRRRAASIGGEGMTSAFILPDITLHAQHTFPSMTINDGSKCIRHEAASCTACHPQDSKITIPIPIPVSERAVQQDGDMTSATIRPAQAPALALASVIKQVEDELTHLKLQLQSQQRAYNAHDAAIGKRRRILLKTRMERLVAEIERRSEQVYALYDVLEGQKQAAAEAAKAGREARGRDDEAVEETLMSIGIDPAEFSGRVGRGAPLNMEYGLEGAEGSGSESEELPWEGRSYGEESEVEEERKRRSAMF